MRTCAGPQQRRSWNVVDQPTACGVPSAQHKPVRVAELSDGHQAGSHAQALMLDTDEPAETRLRQVRLVVLGLPTGPGS